MPAVNDIGSELWLLDENRCTVSGRQPGEGKRPWANGNAQILIDPQARKNPSKLFWKFPSTPRKGTEFAIDKKGL